MENTKHVIELTADATVVHADGTESSDEVVFGVAFTADADVIHADGTKN